MSPVGAPLLTALNRLAISNISYYDAGDPLKQRHDMSNSCAGIY